MPTLTNVYKILGETQYDHIRSCKMSTKKLGETQNANIDKCLQILGETCCKHTLETIIIFLGRVICERSLLFDCFSSDHQTLQPIQGQTLTDRVY